MPSYEREQARFAALHTHVLGISVDSLWSHRAWAKHLGGISYPLLSDYYPHGAVSAAYGVLRDDPSQPLHGAAERSVFIIDGQGVIRWLRLYPILHQPDVEDALAVLAQLV